MIPNPERWEGSRYEDRLPMFENASQNSRCTLDCRNQELVWITPLQMKRRSGMRNSIYILYCLVKRSFLQTGVNDDKRLVKISFVG